MARRSLRRARSIGAETRSVAAPACAIAVVLAVAIAAARGSAAPARAQGDGPRFEGITVLADGHHAFARLAGRDESAPPLWVEAAILPPVIDSLIDCAPPACDPDAPRATAHAQTVPDGSLEFTFVTAGPFQRRPVRFAPGDRLRLRALGERVEAVTTVAPLVVAPVDAAADRLSGTGPAGARLSITANRPDGAFAFSQATVDADGRWSADLAGTLDLVPGAFGAVSTIVDGTTTQASWSVPRAFVRLGDPVIDVYARSGDGADVYQSCAGNGTENDHLGRAVVWRGASEATPLLLRDRSGALAAPGALNCYELTFAIGGLPQPVPVALDNDVEIDTVADEVRSKGSWPAGRYRVEAGGVTRVVEVTALSSTLSVPLDGVVDLTSTLPVDVATADDTATIGWSLRAYPLSIDDIDPTIVRVRGRGTAGRYVVVTIGDDDHASGAAVIGPDGTFDATVRYAASRAPVPLDDATVIQVSDVVEPRLGPGDVPQPVPETVTFVAAPLHARALANRDLVEGTARPGAHIQVRAGSERDPHIVDTLAAASNGE
ncbi:MAG: hypothetical protein ABI780_12510, partial [Ardenticatenales bacterium]